MKFLYNPKEITYTDLAIWNNIFQWGYRIINTANMVISRADNDGINWGSGADAENRKNEVFAEAIGITGVVLSKLDGSAKGGIVVSVQKELGVPVKLVGLGEGPDDLAPFDPEGFVDGILA